MNWWMVAAGLLYLGATGNEIARQSYPLAGVYLCYAIASFLLGGVK